MRIDLVGALTRIVPWTLVALQCWLLDRLLRQHGRALFEQERLGWRATGLAQASPAATEGSLAPGPSRADKVRAAECAHYQRMQDEAIRSVPPYPAERFAGAGIVILAGGPRYYTNAWVCLAMLRRVLGCRLPIQVWYLGPHEMSPRMIELLQRFDVECVDALEVQRHHPRRALGGWEAKPYAILHSRFKEVIYLDADNVPLIEPASLLECTEYRATGASFWPDLRNLGRENPIWEICRVAYRDEPEFETGQIVIDKERSWKALHLTLHLNEQSDFYYQHVHGDKETFHMAWRMLDQPYCMPPTRPTWAVGMISPGDAGMADVLQQHDFDGRIAFHHRTGAKWSAWGKNFRVSAFEHEAVCLQALEELRQHWDGRVDAAQAVAGASAIEAELLRSRFYLYRRIGSDERVLSFLPGQRVGDGGTHWEQRWRLEEEPGCQSLVIEGWKGVTCTLFRDPDGVWRGHWLHQEQMPVELIPLSAGAIAPSTTMHEGSAGPGGIR
jgi:hypothetical protein